MSGKKKEQIVRVDLYQSPRRIEIKLSSPKLREWFRKVAPNIPVDEHHKVKLDEIKPEGIEEVVGMISEKLRRIAQGDSYD
jgi:galactose-1-phosphate uridylyltransferase